MDFGNSRIRLWTRKRQGGTYEYDWLPMTRELRKSLMWWWEHRPIKDQSHVFLCLDKTEFCREYYGHPFMYRLHFMQRLCERAKVTRFGFHAIGTAPLRLHPVQAGIRGRGHASHTQEQEPQYDRAVFEEHWTGTGPRGPGGCQSFGI
jgi:hypothetical protein